jgi:ABC-type glycerol-3-phosphate transport system permease component
MIVYLSFIRLIFVILSETFLLVMKSMCLDGILYMIMALLRLIQSSVVTRPSLVPLFPNQRAYRTVFQRQRAREEVDGEKYKYMFQRQIEPCSTGDAFRLNTRRSAVSVAHSLVYVGCRPCNVRS